MGAHTLRPYQEDGFRRVLEAYKRGAKRVLMVLATGGGKTTVFGKLIEQTAERNHRSLILVHRRELATQAANRLQEFGVRYGMIMANTTPTPYAPVQIATVQTLVRRKLPQAGLIVCDEAHLSTAETWAQTLAQYPNAKVLGVTATPWRMGGKPLAGAYDEVVVVATPGQLRQQGYLCDYQGFGYLAPDLSGVKTTGGEYNEQQSAAAMRQSGIVANIVEKWRAHASHLSTVVFAVTVEHSQQLAREFQAAGVRAEHLDGATPLDKRNAIMRRLADGTTQVLCNVGVAVEGIDIPRLKCCVLARPTKSLARAIQMMGRVRRPWEGQTARIHDHAFVIAEHGLPDDDRDYTIHAKESRGNSSEGDEIPPLTTCSSCGCIFHGSSCPECSTPRPVVEREIHTVEGAEEFGFDSSSAAPVQIPATPTRVQWKNVGRVIEGIFERAYTEPTSWGQQTRYVVRGKDRRHDFPGTTRLDTLMRAIKPDDQIRVTFTGETQIGDGRRRKEFRVEKEEPEDPREAVKREAIRIYVEEKISFKEVAHRLGVGAVTVYRWCREAGVSRPHSVSNFVAPGVREEAVRIYVEEELSTREVAHKLGVSARAVCGWVREAGVTRSMSETFRLCRKPRGVAHLRLAPTPHTPWEEFELVAA